MREVLKALLEALEAKEPVALATVAKVKGSSPAKVGNKMLVRADGPSLGTVGGGKLEERVISEARSALEEGRSRLVHYALREEGEDAVGMLCGGEATVFIEVYQPQPTLLIVGGGHIGQPLAKMARLLDFEVAVVDVEPGRASVEGLDQVDITQSTYIVITTADHVSDEAALRQVVGSPAAYIGMIGSRRKVGTIFDHLRREGVPEEELRRVHAPIGLDLGGGRSAEIALSIMAEIVKERYGGTGRPLRRRRGAG